MVTGVPERSVGIAGAAPLPGPCGRCAVCRVSERGCREAPSARQELVSIGWGWLCYPLVRFYACQACHAYPAGGV